MYIELFSLSSLVIGGLLEIVLELMFLSEKSHEKWSKYEDTHALHTGNKKDEIMSSFVTIRSNITEQIDPRSVLFLFYENACRTTNISELVAFKRKHHFMPLLLFRDHGKFTKVCFTNSNITEKQCIILIQYVCHNFYNYNYYKVITIIFVLLLRTSA